MSLPLLIILLDTKETNFSNLLTIIKYDLFSVVLLFCVSLTHTSLVKSVLLNGQHNYMIRHVFESDETDVLLTNVDLQGYKLHVLQAYKTNTTYYSIIHSDTPQQFLTFAVHNTVYLDIYIYI